MRRDGRHAGLPTRRWILTRTWDRFQIPKPFCRIDVHFGEPIEVAAGDDPVAVTAHVKAILDALERRHDPAEAPPSGAPASVP